MNIDLKKFASENFIKSIWYRSQAGRERMLNDLKNAGYSKTHSESLILDFCNKKKRSPK